MSLTDALSISIGVIAAFAIWVVLVGESFPPGTGIDPRRKILLFSEPVTWGPPPISWLKQWIAKHPLRWSKMEFWMKFAAGVGAVVAVALQLIS